MPRFQYQANFGEGHVMNGAVEAGSEQEAMQILALRGLGNAKIVAAASPAPASPAPAAHSAARRPQQHPTAPGQASGQVRTSPSGQSNSKVISGDPFSAQVQRPNPSTSRISTEAPVQSGMQINTPQSSAKPVYETKRGSNKILRFLFTQLANYTEAGVNPVQAFSQLAGQTSQQQYREPLARAAQLASEGIPFSAVMEMYPDLFPQGTVGMVRAGEQGGYLPEAYREASRIADLARKMNIWAGVTYVNFIATVVFIWPIWMVTRSITHMWSSENAHYNANGLGVLGHSVFKFFIWPFGPLIISSVLIGIYAPRWWLRRSNTQTRHAWALRLWSLKQRAIAESMEVFSWNLSRTSAAGLSPLKCFELSAGAVPNQIIAESLKEARNRNAENITLTSLLTQVPYVSGEMVAMAQTGEMTGQMQEMMLQASQMEAHNFQIQKVASATKLGCWILLVMIVGTGIGAIIMALAYAGILKGLMN